MMEKLRKFFFEQDMSWKKVIIMALVSALVTGVICIIPAVTGTSIGDIGVNFDVWILIAIVIIANCHSWKEAALKTVVFFLISQPLIYLIQVPFKSEGFGIFRHYIFWFEVTVLTVPGAIVAYQIKRKDWISTIVLSVATGFLGYMASQYIWNVVANFPRHLLSLLFCLIVSFVMIFVFLEDKTKRIVAIGITLLVLVVSLIITKPNSKETIIIDGDNWTYVIDNEDIISVDYENGVASITSLKDGSTYLTFTNDDGEMLEYYVTVSNGSIIINTFD